MAFCSNAKQEEEEKKNDLSISEKNDHNEKWNCLQQCGLKKAVGKMKYASTQKASLNRKEVILCCVSERHCVLEAPSAISALFPSGVIKR